jgi:hypothetical protein
VDKSLRLEALNPYSREELMLEQLSRMNILGCPEMVEMVEMILRSQREGEEKKDSGNPWEAQKRERADWPKKLYASPETDSLPSRSPEDTLAVSGLATSLRPLPWVLSIYFFLLI